MKIKKLIMQNYPSIMVCILFILTQFILTIHINSINIHIYYVEFLLLIFGFILLISFIKNKEYIRKNKALCTFIMLLFFWYVILTLYRFFAFKNLTGGFVIFRILFLPILLFCFFHKFEINKKSLLIGIVIFLFMVNCYQVWDLITTSHNFRQINGLQNINIYLCFSIGVIPLMFYLINNYNFNKYQKKLLEIIIFINTIFVIVFSIFSGSRIGIIMGPFITLVSYYLEYKKNICNIIQFALIFIISFTIILLCVNFKVYDSQYNIYRSSIAIKNIFTNKSPNYDDLNNNILGDTPTTDSNPDSVINPNNNSNLNSNNNSNLNSNNSSLVGQINIVDSNNMRSLLWKKATEYIKEDPIFGRVNPDIEIEMYYVGIEDPIYVKQSAHNFILEIWLALGLPGLIIYSLINIFMVIKILIKKYKFNIKLNFMLILFVIFGFSFFQPLVSSFYVISLLLWFSYFIYYEKDKDNIVN